MRKFALAATAVAALTVGLQTPAFAAAPDAPTEVKVSWADSGHVKVTWADNGEANEVFVQYTPTSEIKLGDVVSTAANELLIPTGTFQNTDHVRLTVRAIAADGSSPSALSPEFDTWGPAAPVLQDANLLANLSTQLQWTRPAGTDATPNDPLDNSPYEGTEVTAVRPNGTTASLGTYEVGTTSATIAPQPRPTTLGLTALTPWGGDPKAVKTVKLGTLGAGITVPASALYSNRLAIKSTLDLFTSQGREERASGIKVELQARGKTTDAWKTYGRYDGNTTTAFDTGMAAQGNRQYRLFVPARKVVSGNVIVLTPATSTSVKSSKTFVKFLPGGFNPSVVRVGGRSTFSVKISPAVSVKVQLWGWRSGTWIALGDLPLTKGSYVERGDIETERYTLRLRVVAPTLVVNGLTVSANTSPAYNLTVK
ncbi:hypothetical protein E1263_23735 [Kribbella antibiotica]|uniref:Fibronectin type III domain-containing protein n=1 Tax=Kribbella antibiotica TaxID=190195 RepID=A0A4R4ZIC1_9ACTN|nr:hypothetical protein [Kribbella antibiotica]TDD57464.1 hypothetical protein E1263_23735 [Kribbella antibiotica]